MDDVSAATVEPIERYKPVPLYADWLVYVGMAVCSLTKALAGNVITNADTVAYLDLSDAARAHQWHTLVNGYWFPLFPTLLAAGRALFGFRPQYEMTAVRLVTLICALPFVLSAVALAASVRRLLLNKGIGTNELIPARTLYLWVALFSYFFAIQDFSIISPDALLSAFMILCLAALVWTRVGGSLASYGAVGLFAGLAFWTKTFAFPFFVILIFFALTVSWRRFYIWSRLGFSVLVFIAVVGPYVWQLSRTEEHLTFGDTGALAFAWYENGADRFNPVDDPSVYHRGTALVRFTHPGELLSVNPEIAYYGHHNIPGSTPQWDNPPYWWNGMTPRMHPREAAKTLTITLRVLLRIFVMRFQAIIFIVALWLWGFVFRKRSLVDHIFTAIVLALMSCLGLYLLVWLEGRYVVFAFVAAGAVYAASAISQQPRRGLRSIHVTVLIMAALFLINNFQSSLREADIAMKAGARPLHGIYDQGVVTAGADLRSRLAAGSEVACMGDKACWADPYWARYAGVRLTAIIESGNGWELESAETGCQTLEHNPAVLDLLRQRHIRVIVAKFDGTCLCSGNWKPLGKSTNFFFFQL